jgi:2-phospho-L-lactate guanylyltransferase
MSEAAPRPLRMLRAVLAIVPVRGRDGKSRLDGFLSSDERARLVEAMLADVLAACAEASVVSRTLVVTPDRTLAYGGGDVLHDEAAGHAEAIAGALCDPRARRGVLVVMGDCPLASGDSLNRLADAAKPVAVAPATDGGMNALALQEVGAFEPAFGVAHAAALTVERARAAGIEAAVADDPSLAFDVDNPADVWRLREHEVTTRAQEALCEILQDTGGLV